MTSRKAEESDMLRLRHIDELKSQMVYLSIYHIYIYVYIHVHIHRYISNRCTRWYIYLSFPEPYALYGLKHKVQGRIDRCTRWYIYGRSIYPSLNLML
jgi:hypothetical protein